MAWRGLPASGDRRWAETAKVAVEALEAMGCEVVVPREFVCCARPLYDYGFLDMAKARLKKTLRTMEPYQAAGTPIVGLEPSCVAVFRDELPGMLPDDAQGRKMTKLTRTLGEYLSQRSGFELPRLERKAIDAGQPPELVEQGGQSSRDPRGIPYVDVGDPVPRRAPDAQAVWLGLAAPSSSPRRAGRVHRAQRVGKPLHGIGRCSDRQQVRGQTGARVRELQNSSVVLGACAPSAGPCRRGRPA
ncbi:MAG: (Fe-S)-binding protein [Myxococcales bacterium]